MFLFDSLRELFYRSLELEVRDQSKQRDSQHQEFKKIIEEKNSFL